LYENPREKLMRGEEVTSRKTHTRTPTSSQLQGEGTLRTTPTRIPTRLPREEVEGEEASLPSPSTTTRPRLTTRSALTPMTSYPISRWSTKAGGSGKPMDASASSQQTMLRCGNDVSEGDVEAEVEEERRSEADPTNIKTPCPPHLLPCLLIFLKCFRKGRKTKQRGNILSFSCLVLCFSSNIYISDPLL